MEYITGNNKKDGFVGISVYDWVGDFTAISDLLKLAYNDLEWLNDCGYSFAAIQICPLNGGTGIKEHVHHLFERKESHLVSFEKNDRQFKEFTGGYTCRTCRLNIKVIISLSSGEMITQSNTEHNLLHQTTR
jgi:hypothetical protein